MESAFLYCYQVNKFIFSHIITGFLISSSVFYFTVFLAYFVQRWFAVKILYIYSKMKFNFYSGEHFAHSDNMMLRRRNFNLSLSV